MANKLLKASFGVTIVMFVGYFISFLKESVIANYYGVCSDVDAYTIAIEIPVELFTFVTVAIQSVVVPIYSDHLYNKDEKTAKQYIDNLITILVAGSLVFILFGELFSGLLTTLFAPGFDEATHNLCSELVRIVFPSILFSVVCQVIIAVLNVHKQFVINSFSLYFMNICTIVSVVLLHEEFGIYAAAGGLLVGNVAKCLFVVFLAKKYYHYTFSFAYKDESVKRTLKQSVPVFWSMSIAEFTTIVNKIVASFLFVGSISALTYASKINTVLMQLFVSAIATVVYPLYAESSAKSDTKQLNNRINLTISGFALFIMPLMAGIFTFREEIVSLAFGRGAFDSDAIHRTQSILGYYTIGLLFMSLRSTITNIFYSLQDTKTPSVNASIGAIINLILNITLPFIMGVEGLALASSLTAIYITVMLLYQLTKKHKEICLSVFFGNLKWISLSTIILFVAIFAFHNYCKDDFSNLNILLMGTLIGVCAYTAAVLIFKVPIMKQMINMLKQKN